MGGLNRFLSEEQINTLSSVGIHKIAAALENLNTGSDIEEIDLEATAYLLGRKVYEKRASRSKIASGLAALRNLRGE